MTIKKLNAIVAVMLGLVISPAAAAAAEDNFAFVEQMKQKGAYARTLSTTEEKTIQGANWTVVRQLMMLNVRIYGRVGWELGRLISIRQYGVDPGAYPGLYQALTGRF